MSLLTNIIAEAHMSGQKDAGCAHPSWSWGNACGYVAQIETGTLLKACYQYIAEHAVPKGCGAGGLAVKVIETETKRILTSYLVEV